MHQTTRTDTAPRSLSDIVAAVEALGAQQDSVKIDDIIHALGRASTAALLFIPAMIAATPLSGIPGLSAFCGIIIALVAAQSVIGRKKLWLPGFLRRRSIDGQKLHDGLDKVRGVTAFLDRHTHERLHVLVRGIGAKLLFLLCMLGGMVMPVLELIPFSASAVAISVVLLSVAILTLDGLFAACALGVMGGAVALVLYLV